VINLEKQNTSHIKRTISKQPTHQSLISSIPVLSVLESLKKPKAGRDKPIVRVNYTMMKSNLEELENVQGRKGSGLDLCLQKSSKQLN
jgi:hypothetical protein